MLDYCSLFAARAPTRLKEWLRPLSDKCETALSPSAHGDLARWRGTLERLPLLAAKRLDFTADAVEVGGAETCDSDLRITIEALLRELHPWRKGPYRIHGIHIDTEWRSDLKWRRIAPHLQPLQGRVVLDVGCGNGYHVWRMLGAGARLVVGIDPTLLSVMQFHAIKHFAGDWPVHVLPVGIEDVPSDVAAFDSVFSMGVLYHRRSPIDHLLELKGLLRPGGELVLETLVLEGEGERVLVPEGRYAQMRNVWFIPTCQSLAGWLKRCGYVQVRVVDVTKTTALEQRSTDWMRFQSLPDFLDPKDPGRTCEGLPAPRRAIFLARKP